MSGIKGQPTPKPKDAVKAQEINVGEDPFAELEEFAPQDTGSADFSELDSMGASGEGQTGGLSQEGEQVAQRPATDITRAGLIQGAINTLPAVGGVVGGILGTGAAPGVGTVIGAGAGAAAGYSLKQTIERAVFGPNAGAQTRQQFYTNLGKEAALGAAGEGVGQIAGKALSATGQAAKAPFEALRNHVAKNVDEITKPAHEILSQKITPMDAEQAGNAVKQLLSTDIKTKYGPFIKAYSELDTVAKAIPIKDESRRAFTNKTKSWALDNLSGDNYRMVKKFADDFDAAGTGRQFEDILGQISDARGRALSTNSTKQAAVLKELESMADNFLEGETTKLAAKISAGKATPQERQFIDQIMQSRGLVGEDSLKYAKSLSRDYLNNKAKVAKDYAGFRGFLEDVGEQAKVKVGKKGPMRFLDELNDVPAEKLVERMFDPKNSAALKRMEKESPEVFDHVVRTKVNQLITKSSPDGDLNLRSLYNELNKMPPTARKMLFDDAEMNAIKQGFANPRLKTLERLQKRAETFVLNFVDDVSEIGRMTSSRRPSPLKPSKTNVGRTAVRQAVGKQVVSPLIQGFGSQNEGD
jgi:hypothetical protein